MGKLTTEEVATEEVAVQEAAELEAEEMVTQDANDDGEQIPREGDETKPKKNVQERINELTFKFREAERDAERWRSIAETKVGNTEPDEPAKKSAPSDRPVAGSFETVEEYEDALYGWYDNKREKKNRQERGQRDQVELLEKFDNKAKDLRGKHDDFDAAINAPVFTDAMRSVIFTIDNGPMVAYHLGKNPTVANKIKTLPPERQIYEISKLETQLLLAQKGKKTTTAPEPLNPVNDNGGVTTDPDKMTTAQWMKWDNERRLVRIKKNMGQKV